MKKSFILATGVVLLLVFSLTLLGIAQECKGPNLNLTVVDTKGEITNLACGYIGSDSAYVVYFYTEGFTGNLVVELNRIKKITPVRDPEGKTIRNGSTLLSILELNNSDSKRLYINYFTTVGGYSSWGKQSFELQNIQTVEIN